MKNWKVYYMDNDGRKQIIKSGLRYMEAVKLWQHYNTERINGTGGYNACYYE